MYDIINNKKPGILTVSIVVIIALIVLVNVRLSDPKREGMSRSRALFSDLQGQVKLLGEGGAWELVPDREFIIIDVDIDDENFLNVSKWSLGNKDGRYPLGDAVLLPRQGKVNKSSEITLTMDSRLIVTSGESPIGVSFRENLCSGFLDQYQEFVPPLEDNCPLFVRELARELPPDDQPGEACLAYAESLPRCRFTQRELPLGVNATCRDFISNHINYNSCVETLKEKVGFLSGQWRIFLDSKVELWDNDFEAITLRDENGVSLDILSY